MSKVAIVTDSVACLTREQVEQYGIRIVPVNVMFGDEIYRNGVDLTMSEAYRLLERAPEHFSTSPASPTCYANVFRELGAQAQDILCVTISSKLSTLFNVATLAKEQVRDEIPQTTIEIMDSKTAAAGEALIVLDAARVAVQSNELTEVTQAAQIVRDRVHVACFLDTIRYVYRTGRIPKIAAQVGAMLSVKPIVTISDGLVQFAGVTRTTQHGVEKLIETMRQKVGAEPVHVAVVHADALEEGEKLKECAHPSSIVLSSFLPNSARSWAMPLDVVCWD